MHSDQLAECAASHQRFEEHIKESAGVRDRLKEAEMDIKNLKEKVNSFPIEVTKAAITGGIIGSLIGSGAAPTVSKFVTLLLGGQ